MPPGFNDGLGMGEIQEPVLVQTFITQPSVERLDVGILAPEGSLRHDGYRFVRGVIDDGKTLDHPPVRYCRQTRNPLTRLRWRRRDVPAAGLREFVPPTQVLDRDLSIGLA